jgi:glycosyltransferase involved in cell wall biosynthesis
MKQNVFYIGHYYDNNGLGESCRRYLDCLSSIRKVNLTSRPIYVTYNSISKLHKSNQYNEYEDNKFKKYNILIQQTFPEYLEYHKEFGKNIAILEIETANIAASGRVDKINMMDEIWVGSEFSAKSLQLAGVFKPIKVIPEPYEILEYETEKKDFFKYESEIRPFIFYTIGQYSEKKNIKSMIMAYLLEFNKKDNVRLFIKTNDYRIENNDLENIIKHDMNTIKNIIRKPADMYPDVDIVCGYLSKKDIIRLHKSSNCYINSVRGDGFGSSAIEAALSDNQVINTKNIGSATYFNNNNAFMVNSIETKTVCSNSMIINAYTINETWFEPSLADIRNCMRKAYNARLDKTIEYKSENFDKTIFSHELIKTQII